MATSTQLNTTLSAHDSHVLNALFDPELSLTSPTPTIDTCSHSAPSSIEDEDPVLQSTEADAIRPLNEPNPSRSDIVLAIQTLGELIEKQPSYASAYTNRAQARRLLVGSQLFTASGASTMESILSDLSKAITLTTPSSPSTPLSHRQAKLLSTAHTHRAYLLYTTSQSGNLNTLPESLRKLGTERVEEMASRDFFLGGSYGDKIARQMSVHTNPYAKLCGAIVTEALKKEYTENI